MVYHIPGKNIFFLILTSFLILIIFLSLILLAKKRLTNINNISLLLGCLVWFIAVYVESIFHRILLGYFKSNIFSYALYGGFMAGLFEETGRLICFLYKLKPSKYHKNNSLFYGIGHGGFEAVYLLVINYWVILIFCILINKGLLDEYEEKKDSLTDFEKQIYDTMMKIYDSLKNNLSFFNFCFCVVWERISAITYHISASVLVWYASSDFKKYCKLYLLAILLHSSFDFFAVIFGHYISIIFIVELFICGMSIGCAYIAYKCWKYFEVNIEVKNNLINYEAIV